jgi:hypothetical protein
MTILKDGNGNPQGVIREGAGGMKRFREARNDQSGNPSIFRGRDVIAQKG